MADKIKLFFQEVKTFFRSVPSVLVALTVIAVVAMNILANKSISLPVDWLALDCGIVFSWLVFLSMDIVTRRFGVKAANMLSIFALLVNLLVAVILVAASYIPGIWSQSFVEGSESVINSSLDKTFRGEWFVLLGSSTAFIVSAVLNNVLHAAFEKLLKDKHRAVAFTVSSYASTFIAQFVDNLLFALIVSLNFFGWTIVQCVTCAVTGAVIELLFEIAFSPIGYRVVKRLEDEKVGQEYLNLINGGTQNESVGVGCE
ncbi:MAG: VUT family protein [Clostridia bacterium]|nr:VUT family protein [Clostridia bacterium]